MELVKKLRRYDHGFLTVEGALSFSKPFGFEARTYWADATPHLPKGLTFNDPNCKGAYGIDAQDLAMQICDHVGVDYPEMFGRGSQLRVCCDRLEEYLKPKH